MHRLAAGVLVGLVALGACSSSDPVLESETELEPPPVKTLEIKSDLPAPIEARLESAVLATMNAAGIPGAYVGVFVPGAGDWQAVGGVADIESATPVTFGLNWPIRSVTKSFVVTALLQLVDAGRVGLDDPVDRYVDGVPSGDETTLRQLANMSSGLPNYTSTPAFLEAFTTDPSQDFSIADLNAYAFTESPEFAPGLEQWYSNTNTNLIGQVIETVTELPLERVLTDQIFDPLGLSGTVYLPNELPDPHATGYQPGPGGYVSPPDNLSSMGPSGAIVSTADDLRAWAEALATGTLLDTVTQTARLEAGPLVEGPIYDAYGLGIGTRAGYWGHTGQGLGFTALAMHEPESGSTIVILANASETKPQPMDGLFAAVVPIVASI